MSKNGFAKPGDILGKKEQRKYVTVVVEGQKFCLVNWTSREMGKWNSDNRRRDHRDTANERMIQLCCVDPDTHTLIFTDEDVDSLRDLDAGFIVKLTNFCLEHVGAGLYSDEDPEKN